jgi:hypothetical protein
VTGVCRRGGGERPSVVDPQTEAGIGLWMVYRFGQHRTRVELGKRRLLCYKDAAYSSVGCDPTIGSPSCPHRLVRPRTSALQAENAGSNPAGDTTRGGRYGGRPKTPPSHPPTASRTSPVLRSDTCPSRKPRPSGGSCAHSKTRRHAATRASWCGNLPSSGNATAAPWSGWCPGRASGQSMSSDRCGRP